MTWFTAWVIRVLGIDCSCEGCAIGRRKDLRAAQNARAIQWKLAQRGQERANNLCPWLDEEPATWAVFGEANEDVGA